MKTTEDMLAARAVLAWAKAAGEDPTIEEEMAAEGTDFLVKRVDPPKPSAFVAFREAAGRSRQRLPHIFGRGDAKRDPEPVLVMPVLTEDALRALGLDPDELGRMPDRAEARRMVLRAITLQPPERLEAMASDPVDEVWKWGRANHVTVTEVGSNWNTVKELREQSGAAGESAADREP